MPQQQQPYITLDSVITDYLNESEQSINKYAKLWHIAFRGFEQLGIDFFYRVQAVKLVVNANLTVNLPADYLNWTKVGILNDRGSIIPLYYNPNLTTYADLLPNRISQVEDPNSEWLTWNTTTWANIWNGNNFYTMYGVPSGEPFVGWFKVDTANGVIIIQPNFANQFNETYIMLEYVCSPIEGQEYYLPMQFREALIAWLWWKDGKAKPMTTHIKLGSARDAKHEFYNERRNAIARWKPARIMEEYQVSQEQTRLAIKT